jgi:sialate O-acetylesterase
VNPRLLSRLAYCLFVVCSCAAFGEVRLPKLLSDHAVLQRKAPIHIWGWAAPGEHIVVTLHGRKQTASTDELGEWSLYLMPEDAGGPYQMTVEGTNTLTLSDVLIGDVWLASGQSNMEMPLKGFPGSAVVKDGAIEIAHADAPQIRLLRIAHKSTDYPLRDIDASWTTCTPQTAAEFSAVAYFFGREVQKHERVPIGLVDATWGGSPAEAWISLDGLSADSSLMPVFKARAQMVDMQSESAAIIEKERREDAAARSANQPVPKHHWHPDPDSWRPSGLFNGMIAPEAKLSIKGVIWYQGEANTDAARAPMYRKVFSALIADWRAKWQQGNFPFLFVQLSSFGADPAEDWGMVRDAQRRTLDVANNAMAVTLDVGDTENVHSADKQTVGKRLALAARAVAYGEAIEYSGPLFRQVTPEGASLRVWFDHTADGLTANGGALQRFEIAGEDHRFVSAAANDSQERHLDLVINLSYAGRQPSLPLRLIFLGPGMHGSLKNDLAPLYLYRDVFRIDLCTANQSLLDLLFQFCRCYMRLDRDQIADPFYAPQPSNDSLGLLALILPFDLALQCDPALRNGDLNLVSGHAHIPLQRIDSGLCDVGVSAFGG